MGSPNFLPFLILHFLLLTLILQTTAQFTFRHSWCSDTTYSPNSTYQSNLNTVLNSLSSNTQITYGFYNFTAGQVPNKVSSLAFCRGDVPLGTCRVCLRDSAKLLPQTCPNQKESFGYSEYCSVFISNRSIYGKVQETPQWYLSSDTVQDPNAFNRTLYGLMGTLQEKAASGDAEIKYATGEVNLTGGGVLYGLVQCTPDLSKSNCIQCIQGSLDLLRTCCVLPSSSSAAVRIVVPSCFVRYETSPFYGNVPNFALPAPPPLPPSSNTTTTTTSTAVGRSKKSPKPSVIAIPVVGVAIVIISAVFFILLKKRKQRKYWANFNKDEINTLDSLQFSLGVIKHATQDFSENNELGQGGFGTVYKGVLPDGQEIAVKRLRRNTGGQGDVQFKNEILILAKLQHRNLVRLLGFCLHPGEMLLVYEFVAHRSLDNFLFDPLQRESMLWDTRYRIINGISRGLLYLHEESRLRIIHRDLKPGNVLLDTEFNPKIADFGMARLFDIDQTQAVASRIGGTYGYMPPEYVIQGQVSMKSDVYGFGVLVLEIISGQRISSFLDEDNPENLLSFAWKNWMDGMAWNVVDPALSSGSSTEIMRCIHIGLLCVQENPADRPTMSSVVMMLSSYSLALAVPCQPAFFVESNLQSSVSVPSQGNASTQSSSRSARETVNGITITDFYPR